jgi:hypothetical protein
LEVATINNVENAGGCRKVQIGNRGMHISF